MSKQVTIIPAKLNRATFTPLDQPKKRKVAGYARVSTDSEEQQTSYEAQVSYYTEYIQKRADWEFTGVYTDQGISATNTKHRDGFNRMITDALDGKIDLIVTKSVSRFARNTVDSLTTVRKLKEKGITVIIQTIPPFDYDDKNTKIWEEVNSFINETLSKEADGLFDTVNFLSVSKDKPQMSLYGPHPNETGHKIWGDKLSDFLKKYL